MEQTDQPWTKRVEICRRCSQVESGSIAFFFLQKQRRRTDVCVIHTFPWHGRTHTFEVSISGLAKGLGYQISQNRTILTGFPFKKNGLIMERKTNQSISECFGADLDGAEPASTWHHAESVLQSRKKKAVWFSSVHEKVASTEHSQPLQSTCIFWSLNLDIECNPYQSFNPSNCLVHVSNPLLRVCRGLGRKLRRDTAEILRSEEKLYMCQNLLGHLAIWLLRSSLTHASLDWDGEKQDTDTLWRGLFALSDS